jgi:tRNA(fMet)-specific endonuclease VapC
LDRISERPFYSVIVVGELEYGAFHSSRPKKNLKRLWSFLKQGTILDVSRVTARRNAHIRQDLAAKGKPIPEADIWIAATCLENDFALLSDDQHFKQVPKLKCFNWTEPIST